MGSQGTGYREVENPGCRKHRVWWKTLGLMGNREYQFFFTKISIFHTIMLSISAWNMFLDQIIIGCRQNLDPHFWTPFWPPFWTPFWISFRTPQKIYNLNPYNTCATYHRFFGILVSFNPPCSLKEGVLLLATHFQVFVQHLWGVTNFLAISYLDNFRITCHGLPLSWVFRWPVPTSGIVRHETGEICINIRWGMVSWEFHL